MPFSLQPWLSNLWIWVNYNISLTWIKAIWGWFPLLTTIPVRSKWGRYNLPSWIIPNLVEVSWDPHHLNHWRGRFTEVRISDCWANNLYRIGQSCINPFLTMGSFLLNLEYWQILTVLISPSWPSLVLGMTMGTRHLKGPGSWK
jgi:hypothetical protein